MKTLEMADFIPNVIKEEKFDEENGVKMKETTSMRLNSNTYLREHIPLLRYSVGVGCSINEFVEEIVIADVSGVQISMDESEEVHIDSFDNTIIGYVTSTMGERFLLPHEIRNWLLTEKKELIVTSQGVIMSVTKNKIHLSLDGMHWVDFSFDKESSEERIAVEEILAVEYNPETDMDILTVKGIDGNTYKLAMTCEFNFLALCTIYPNFTLLD